MAEGDGRARTGPDTPVIDAEIGFDTTKGDPVDMPRTPEAQARAAFYAGATEKDRLPEHKARRDRYPLITASNV